MNTNNAGANVHQCQASSAQPLGLNAQSVHASAIGRLQTDSSVAVSAPLPPTFASPQELSLISSQAQQIAQLQVQVQNLIARQQKQQQQPMQQQLMQHDMQSMPQIHHVVSTWSQPAEVSAANHLTTDPSISLATVANMHSTHTSTCINGGASLAAGAFLSSSENSGGNIFSWQPQEQRHQPQKGPVPLPARVDLIGPQDLSALIGLDLKNMPGNFL